MSSSGSAPPDDRSGQEERILEPGRNCWRLEQADRAAVLVDAAAYFARLDSALDMAERSILILGWDFDASIRLRLDGDGNGQALGERLRALVDSRPELQVRILVWDLSTLHAPGATLPLIFGDGWQEHPRISLRLDGAHPIYGAQHQKIVCIDDALAFVGGIDLTVSRWDNPSHEATDPRRCNPDGKPYPPVHDMQMVVVGSAARSVAELARERWRVVAGEELAPAPARSDNPWPPGLTADFTKTRVGIARTVPGWRGRRGIREVAALNADALSTARHNIYIEAQYLAHFGIGDLLAATLAKPDGPEIVIILTESSHGMLERFVMGGNRDRLIRRLRRADRFKRLRIFYPTVPGPGGPCEVLIHSKLIIVDDSFLRIGSSNLNNRSIGLDTECDLAIEAADAASRNAIASIRNRLLAEHLDTDPEVVAAIAAEEGSLVCGIDRLNHRERSLRTCNIDAAGPTQPMFGTRFLDPQKPFPILSRLLRRRPKRR